MCNNYLSAREKRGIILSQNPYLKDVYYDFFQLVRKELVEFQEDELFLEVGVGPGVLKTFWPRLLIADLEVSPWLNLSFDVTFFPFKNNLFSSILGVDLLHHLEKPWLFFEEVRRVLKPGGKLILIEPYATFFSSIVYRLFHPEPFLKGIDYFVEEDIFPQPNQDIARQLFFLFSQKFEEKSGLKIEKKELLLGWYYLFSMGYRPHPLKEFYPLLKNLKYLDKFFSSFLSPWTAFRCFIVIKKPESD